MTNHTICTMITLKRLLPLCAIIFTTSTTSFAEESNTLPEAGKTYVMHRFNEANSYVYENGNALWASPLTNTQKQYWQFIPTGKEGCYYIQNQTSKHYIQSSSVQSESQIKVGDTPVEFEIKKNTTSGAAANGYYYICSTDQTIDTSKDGTLGLNYQQSTGKIVAYHIRYNRNNSYWDIVESDYDYEAPQPIERSEYCKKLGIYVLPCGVKGNAFLKELSITHANKPLSYSASAQPSSYYNMVRSDSATVIPATTLCLSYETSALSADQTVTAYFDWDKDGIFEEKHEFLNATSGMAEIVVPDSAVYGRSRMRIRITDNGLEDADDEVNGMVYDFQIFTIKPKEAPAKVDNICATSPTTSDQKPYGLDGRPVSLNTHKGVYIQSNKKIIK